MLSERISDFVFGCVVFCAQGGFCEEFISECSKRKIVICNLKRNGGKICGSVHYHDMESIFSAGEKSGMEISITSRKGLPDFIIRYRKRFGIPLGLLIFTLITAVLHSVIWSIDITGLEKIPEEEIVSVLENSGIKTGVFSEAVNCKELEYSLYDTFDDISWVNVHITGTRMFVDISEVKEKEHLKTEDYSNIIALKDGEIINAEIFCGEGKLYPGTAVVKGDLLVSGIVNHRDGSVKFVDSEAKIFARTKNFVSSTIPLSFSVKKLGVCKDIYLLSFFGVRLPLGISVKADSFTENRYYFSNPGVIFPIGLIRKHTYSFEEEEICLEEKSALLLTFRDFSLSVLKVYKNCEILSKSISVKFSGNAEIYGDFLCVEDIALKKSFTVEES